MCMLFYSELGLFNLLTCNSRLGNTTYISIDFMMRHLKVLYLLNIGSYSFISTVYV
jgi:hypothetical protein